MAIVKAGFNSRTGSMNSATGLRRENPALQNNTLLRIRIMRIRIHKLPMSYAFFRKMEIVGYTVKTR